LERETARNVEMMWLTGRLTRQGTRAAKRRISRRIADFRNGPAIRSACRQFVALCRSLNLFAQAMVHAHGQEEAGLAGDPARPAATTFRPGISHLILA
jgi:hypothetical protein